MEGDGGIQQGWQDPGAWDQQPLCAQPPFPPILLCFFAALEWSYVCRPAHVLCCVIDTPADVNEILSIATIRPEVVQNKFCPFSPGFQYSADGSDPVDYFQSLGMAYVSYSTLSGWPLHHLGAISPKDDPHVCE